MASRCVFFSPSAAATLRAANGAARSVAAIARKIPLRSMSLSLAFIHISLARIEAALYGHIADDGGALHAPALRVIVVGGVVLRAGIIPEHDRVRLPAQAELIFGHVRLLEQYIEQCAALVRVQTFDAHGELRIDEDR